jgi:hypothetical protein
MASNRTANTAQGRASLGGEGRPPSPRLRLKLRSVDDVCAELARLYREAKAGRRDVSDASKLANMLSNLGRMIEGATLEGRVEELERLQEHRDTAWSARH